jgi:hypothetical protein
VGEEMTDRAKLKSTITSMLSQGGCAKWVLYENIQPAMRDDSHLPMWRKISRMVDIMAKEGEIEYDRTFHLWRLVEKAK